MAFHSCSDNECFSKQDRIKAHPCVAATHVSAYPLNNSCYFLLGFAFGQRLFTSQCSDTQGGSFGVLKMFLDVLGSAFLLLHDDRLRKFLLFPLASVFLRVVTPAEHASVYAASVS